MGNKTWQKIAESDYSVSLNRKELLLKVNSADRMIKLELNISPVFEFVKQVIKNNPNLLKE